MSKLSLIAVLVLGLVPAIDCRGDAATPIIKWRAYWIPWHDTYATWNWTKVEAPALIQWANLEKFPADVKNWEFAACSATNPGKTAREPLATCLADNTWELDRWLPGNFPVDRLAALGDGTFLCAILADGQRISNVSRVKIDRAGEPILGPGIQISPVILFHDDIRVLAIRLIPAPGQHIHLFDLYCPYLCVNDLWSHPSISAFDGVNMELKPGSVQGMIAGFDAFDPAIKPFKEAKVRVKFTEDALSHPWDGQNLLRTENDTAKRMKFEAEHAKGYMSDNVTLSFNDAGIIKFDAAFGLK
jgi:hypothetical protein